LPYFNLNFFTLGIIEIPVLLAIILLRHGK